MQHNVHQFAPNNYGVGSKEYLRGRAEGPDSSERIGMVSDDATKSHQLLYLDKLSHLRHWAGPSRSRLLSEPIGELRNKHGEPE